MVSVPQEDRTLQMKAIGSLCAFTHLITRFIPLVRDPDVWTRIYGEVLDFPSGTLKTCERARASSFVSPHVRFPRRLHERMVPP